MTAREQGLESLNRSADICLFVFELQRPPNQEGLRMGVCREGKGRSTRVNLIE